MHKNKLFIFSCFIISFFANIFGVFSQDKLIWDEDFSSNKNGWFVDNFVYLNNGKYVLFNENSDVASWRTTQDRDYKIKVESTWKGGKENFGYGLIFRFQDQQHYYLYWISGNGYYIAGKIDGKTFVPFVKWTPSPNINKNGTNIIEVDLVGDEIKAFINGNALFSQKDSSYLQGGFGFYSQKGVHSEFDNLKVWEHSETTGLKSNAWNLIEKKVFKRGYEAGSDYNITYSDKEGSMTIEYSENIPGFEPKKIIQNWSWSKLPQTIDMDSLIKINAIGKEISNLGNVKNFGWFIVDVFKYNVDPMPMPGYGYGDDIILGYNNTASGKPGNHYTWINYPKGEVKIPKGYKDNKIVIRVSFQTGNGPYCGYYYIYKWVE